MSKRVQIQFNSEVHPGVFHLDTVGDGKICRDLTPHTTGKVVSLRGEQLLTALEAKLLEEAMEVHTAKVDADVMDEIGDVITVLEAIVEARGLLWREIRKVAEAKAERKGTLSQGRFWMPNG